MNADGLAQFAGLHIIKFLSASILESIIAGGSIQLLKWRADVGDTTALKVADIPGS